MDETLKRGEGTLNLLLILGIAGAVLYGFSKITSIAAPAVNAATSAAANLWVSLTSAGPIQVLGNVVLPSGSVVAISSLTWKQDNQGNAYTNINGSVYELAARDGNGNFTLSQVA